MSHDKKQAELDVLEFWQENNIYEKLKKKNLGNNKFNFIEGPPFPTGDAHVGHLRIWAIKDAFLRFKRFKGYDVYARDGYDVHGLPVETKVQKSLGLKTVDDIKEFGEEKFVNECKNYVSKIINDMKGVRKRYGLWIDDNHYQTSHPDYMSLAWRFFKKADEKGLLYKDYRTVAWSPGAETTLSDYEIKDEYRYVDDPSVYVKFKVRKEDTTTGYDESLVIWTTTPWTLQSNILIAVNPEFDYAKALVEINGKEEVLIIAEKLVQKVIEMFSKQIDIKFKSVLEVKKGAEIEGIKYEHVLLDETPTQQDFFKLDNRHVHSVVLADFVTLSEGEDVFEKLEKRGYKHSISDSEEVKEEDKKDAPNKKEGTGIVHIAPGHGFEDYELGKKFKVPVFSPLDSKAIITEGKFEGMYFKDADEHIIKYLTEKGKMLYSTTKNHKYPLCWRTKVPIVYRAVEQWWIKRSEYIENILEENENVNWRPKSAKISFNNLISNADDWPISRQRFWGIPLPIFEDDEGNYIVIESKEELEEKVGKKLEDIHRDDLKDLVIKNSDNGKDMKAVPFTADVWFDSGCASFASHYGEGLTFDEIVKTYYPISWITESEDQTRGWFSSLFNVGYVISDKAPYKNLTYLGFVMDPEGKNKMSKSLSNGIGGNEAIERWGSDLTRYYLMAKKSPEEQINCDPNEINGYSGYFNTLENVFKLISGYLEDNQTRHPTLVFNNLEVEDKWILYKLNNLIKNYGRLFESNDFHLAVRELENFIVRDFSKTYLKVIKERLDEKDENLSTVLDKVLKNSLILTSTISPFIAERLYVSTKFNSKKESIFLENFPNVDDFLIQEAEKKDISENFEIAQDLVQAILNAREKAKIGVRWPLGQVDIGSSIDLSSRLKPFEPLIKKLTNVYKVTYTLKGIDIDYIVKPNFVNIKKDFEDVSLVIKTINLNKYYIVEDIKKDKSSGKYEGITLDYNKHLIKEIQLKGEMVSSEFNYGTVILETNQDEFLLEEGYLREVIRRVQSIRKDLGLEKDEKINISLKGSDVYFIDLIENSGNYFKKKVGIDSISNDKSMSNISKFEIRDKELVIGVDKLN